MTLSIQFHTESEMQELYQHLCSKDAIQDGSLQISTVENNIRVCPEPKSVLRVKNQAKRLNFGIEVSMYWHDPRSSSILAIHNNRMGIAARRPLHQRPPLNTDGPKYHITFYYDEETITKLKITCPHDNYRCESIEELSMHLDGSHDNFKYRPVYERKNEQGVECWGFHSELADHRGDQRASNHADEPYDVNIVAPPEPFNRAKYLNEGNNEFQRRSKLDKASKTPKSPPRTLRNLPDQVKQRPVRIKKKYPVPKAPPGITFFRRFSKRPLKQGELVSESEDEIDTTWADLRINAELAKNTTMPCSVRKFVEAYDKFMREEHLNSDRSAGDALVRFARERGSWLWQAGVFEEFQNKLDELLEDNIIFKETYTACIEIVQALKDPEQDPRRSNTQRMQEDATELSRRLSGLGVGNITPSGSETSNQIQDSTTRKKSNKGKGKGRAKVSEAGHFTPVTADSDGDIEMRDRALGVSDYTSRQNDSPGRPPQDKPVEPSKLPEPVIPYGRCLCGMDAWPDSAPLLVLACSGFVSTSYHFEQ